MTLAILLSLGLAGLVSHWLKKWSRGETPNGFFRYMSNHKKESVSSVMTVMGSIVALFISGDVELTNQVMGNAFLLGYAIDSAVNKDKA